MQERTRFEEIFNAALAEAPERRAEFVRNACGGDEALQREVESLLEWDAEGLAPGTRLGPYEILERAGAGGMGEVYKARDTRLERLVAIKVVSAQLAADPACRARLEREAKAVSALNHPHICVLHDVGRDGEIDYLVMEYLEGETLAQQIARGPLPVADVVRYGIEIAGALAAAHAAGILHRDLKPGNIMLTKSGVKLLDFGLARTVDSTSASEVTATGVLVGTPPYMSPEQVRGEVLDERTDVFSFGAVLYEMATGRCPFAADSRAGVIAAILDRNPAPPSKLNPRTPLALERLIQACVRKEREARLDSMAEAADVLARLEARHGRLAALTRSRRRMYVATVATAILAAALLASGLWPQARPVVRITPLTSDGLWKLAELVVADGRVLYTGAAQPGTPAIRGALWSVSTRGGQSRQEPNPCGQPNETPNILRASYVARTVLLRCAGYYGDPSADLWLVSFDGMRRRRIGRHMSVDLVSLSPDGKTLGFGGPDGFILRPVDGGAETRIPRIEGSGRRTVWHPSGRRIALHRSVPRQPSIWEISAADQWSEPRELLPRFPGEQIASSWSPDGKRLYFLSKSDIYLQDWSNPLGWMREPLPVRLTTGPMEFQSAAENPDTKHVVYALGMNPGVELMKPDSVTGALKPHLPGIAAESVAYARDGSWLAYISFPQRQLWKCRPDGSERTLLVSGVTTGLPQWSPDGSRIVFMAAPLPATSVWGGEARAFLVNTDGGPAKPVSGMPVWASDPTWSPDGQHLAVSGRGYAVRARQELHVAIFDIRTGRITEVPGSEGMWSARWSPLGNFIAAVEYSTHHLFVYSTRTGKWRRLARTSAGWLHWSGDEKYVYLMYIPENSSAPVIARVEVATAKLEQVKEITEFALYTGPGISWTHEAEFVVPKDLATYQIYRIERDR